MDTFTHTTADGREFKFAHLSIFDMLGDPEKPEVNGFVPIFLKRKKRELLENLKLAETPREEYLSYLKGFDEQSREKDPVVLILDYLKETPGAAGTVTTFAWAKAKGEGEMPPLSPEERHAIVSMLLAPFGITFDGKEDDAPPGGDDEPRVTNTSTYGDGGTDPNPQTPVTYSATPGVTGGETGGGTAA